MCNRLIFVLQCDRMFQNGFVEISRNQTEAGNVERGWLQNWVRPSLLPGIAKWGRGGRHWEGSFCTFSGAQGKEAFVVFQIAPRPNLEHTLKEDRVQEPPDALSKWLELWPPPQTVLFPLYFSVRTFLHASPPKDFTSQRGAKPLKPFAPRCELDGNIYNLKQELVYPKESLMG